MKKMFEVEAKCGHVGRKYYTIKSFPVRATSAKEAAAIVRTWPRVKHHQKDAILSVKEITLERYEEIVALNHEDPYFVCTNVQEHRQTVTECDIYLERYVERAEREAPKKLVYVGKELLRNPKRYVKYHRFEEVRYAI